MSSSVSFYTFGNMAAATITAITSEAAGFPKENLLDFNPDTYWKPASTATQTIDFDLGSAKTVDAVCGFLQNYTLAGGYTATKWYSDNGTNWTQDTGNCTWGNLGAGPLRITSLSAPSSHRYWRLVLGIAAAQVPIFSGIWFARRYTISVGNQWPENDTERYFNRKVTASGGREFITRINRNKSMIIPRQYLFATSTPFLALQNVFNDSAGDARPLIIQEGDTYDDAFLVSIESADFNQSKNGYQLYNPSLTFKQLPYIASTETY